MNKSLSEIAHDITLTLLPKSLDEQKLSIWDESDSSMSYNGYDFVSEYTTLHAEILQFLKMHYGNDGENYPR